jgi:hypothetical protein
MAHKVFISKGSAATPKQRDFVDAILTALETAGFSPRIMNENEWSFEQPLKAIKKVIKECDGAVIIAFTRTKFEKGIEIKKDKENALSDILLPTPWNHIEGSIAYSFDLPLLVIAENGLKTEGLIEKGYDWNVYWSDLSADVVRSDSFKGFLSSWKTAVEQYRISKSNSPETSFDPEKLTVSKILNSLTVAQLWKIVAAILTLLIAVATISYKIGGGQFPWDK